MERFQKLLEDPHKYAKEWKARTGGKVLGYFSDYFPEENLSQPEQGNYIWSVPYGSQKVVGRVEGTQGCRAG